MSSINVTNIAHPSSASNNIVLNSDGSATIATLAATDITATTVQGVIKSGTAVASTSGTSIDFTGIPSWVKRVTVMFDGVSTNGTSNWIVQLGTSGGIETTAYDCSSSQFGAAVSTSQFTNGFGLTYSNASAVSAGSMRIDNFGSNTWIANGTFVNTDSAATRLVAGSKALSGVLDRIRVTTVGGTNTFDAGSINLLLEG